jgi:hypothetical protein
MNIVMVIIPIKLVQAGWRKQEPSGLVGVASSGRDPLVPQGR